jgi:pimeloyl-ACP methyl ester carboxylesterase
MIMAQATDGTFIPGSPDPAALGHHRVNGVLLHHAEMGDPSAPLVILLHGFPDFWWGWRHQMAPLANAGLHVVAPDQRGYNLSGKPLGFQAYDLDILAADILALADAYGSSKIRLVGHDFGGLVAWWIAANHPERVGRLAIINAPHPQVVGPYMRRHPTQMMRSLYAGFFQLPFLPEAILSAGNFAVMRRALTGSSRNGTFTPSDLDLYSQAWAQPGALKAMLDWYRALRLRSRVRDARISAPTLLIWGQQDRFLEKGLAEESLSLCDDARSLFFERASHWVHLEEADAVNRALAEFLTPAAHRPSGLSSGA